MKEKVAGKAFDAGLLGKVFSYAFAYKKYFIATVACAILLAFLSPVRPLLIKHAIDNYIVDPDAKLLLYMCLLIAGTLVAEVVLQFSESYLSSLLGQLAIKDLRVKLYEHLVRLKLRFFDTTPIGTLVTRVVSDIETVADIFSQGFFTIIGDLLKLSTILVVMFIINFKLALVSLSTIPILFIVTYWFKNAVKAAFQEVRTQVSKLNAFVQEHVTGMAIVQVFNREEKEYEKFKVINAKHRDANIRSVWYYSLFFPAVEILSSISIAMLVWVGGGQALHEVVSLGDLNAYILFINMLFRPIRQLADRFNTLQMGMVSSERIFKLLESREMIDNSGNKVFPILKGDIEFRNVWFAYKADDWVLKDVSFKIKQGEMLALVGATGAGKSSVVNLVNRFYEYNKGSILIDGNDIRDFDLQALRDKIGLVLQDVYLFSGSILDNITLKDPSISFDSVVKASKEIGAHEFIERLPGGYNYDVRERGAMLSVGQRQLIAFIRAYVYNPSILILDEATSSIDTESEVLIQKATAKLTQNRTSIVVAHRLATIQKADHIAVFHEGKLSEFGTHEALLNKKGLYRNLYEMQFKNNNS